MDFPEKFTNCPEIPAKHPLKPANCTFQVKRNKYTH
jgi:hypothetical protein